MIYIQSNIEKTIPHHFDCSCVLFGAKDNAQKYRLTSYQEVKSGKFDFLIKNNLFVGSVEFMKEVFNRVDIKNLKLPSNSNRKCEIITLKEAHNIVKSGKKIFIKPIEIKLFTGFVLDEMKHSCLNNISEDTLVMSYKPFREKILSEWRIYVHNHKINDSRNYSGDFECNPDYSYVRNVIEENKIKFPCAYTVDVGILESGDNVVIEYNDMWAIGNYGVPNHIYLRMLRNRYFEIMKNNI